MKTGLNYINGSWKASQSGHTFEQRNPAYLTEVTGKWQSSTVGDTREAIDAAAAAFGAWSGLTVHQRAEYLHKMLSLLKERTKQIADVLTSENGKTLKESVSEIDSAVREMGFQINEGLRMTGEQVPSSMGRSGPSTSTG